MSTSTAAFNFLIADIKLLKDLLEKGALNNTGLVNRYLDQIEKHAKLTPQSLFPRLLIRNAKRGLLGALTRYSYYNQGIIVFANFHPKIFVIGQFRYSSKPGFDYNLGQFRALELKASRGCPG
jgi:hypothetical protein